MIQFDAYAEAPFLRFAIDNAPHILDDADLRALLALASIEEAASNTPHGIEMHGYAAGDILRGMNSSDLCHVRPVSVTAALARLVHRGLVNCDRLEGFNLPERFRINERAIIIA